jgi:hypothetical protein
LKCGKISSKSIGVSSLSVGKGNFVYVEPLFLLVNRLNIFKLPVQKIYKI